MTLLGELYADGLGVPNDDKKADEWYRLAAARGDREAMFALAMFRLTGRAGPQNRPEAARLLPTAAKLGHVVAAYDLALLYLEGQVLPQRLRARRRIDPKSAAEAGNPQAQYALATFYKEGRGVKQGRPGGDALARRRGPLGLHRCRDRVRHRAVQRHRRAKERDARRASYFMKAARKGSAIGAEPAGADVCHRPRHQGRSGRGRAAGI